MTSLLLALCIAAASPSFTVGQAEIAAEGFGFTEGPVWLPSGQLLFSDIPGNRIYRDDKSIFRDPSGQSNGLTLDRQGRLIAVEHANRRVSRTEKDGTITVLAEKYQGKRFNSPNDVIAASDGTVFFTDPPYGLKGRLEGPEAELDFCGLYLITPQGKLRLLTKEIKTPNGLALSPGEKLLYVADSQAGYIQVYEKGKDGTLANGKRFADVPNPDGMKIDLEGNVWTTAKDGVRIYSPEGELLQTIPFPQQPSNCAFGGPDGKTLYVTARTSLYKIRLANPAILPPESK